MSQILMSQSEYEGGVSGIIGTMSLNRLLEGILTGDDLRNLKKRPLSHSRLTPSLGTLKALVSKSIKQGQKQKIIHLATESIKMFVYNISRLG